MSGNSVMDAQQTGPEVNVQEIHFPNGRRARLAAPPAGTEPAGILNALDIERPDALIIVVGGAGGLDQAVESDSGLRSRLVQLFSRGVARAAADAGALIVDGGTQSGVMALMGQAVADRGYRSPLLGVAPAGRVTYPGGSAEGGSVDRVPLEPHHSHFVLVPGDEWGDETGAMFELATALGEDIPVVTLLVHGHTDGVTKEEVLHSVRRGWPVIVVQGSGGLADEIAARWQEKQSADGPAFIADPVMAEIIIDGDIHPFPLDCRAEALRRGITRQLGVDATLRMAWNTFALYDANAIRQRRNFERIQGWILALGVVGTLLALGQTQLRVLGWLSERTAWDRVFHYAIVVVPITTSILLAAANRFKAGSKWVLLRGAAEALKREIYRYRARAGMYSPRQTANTSRETKLARRVESISRLLMQTEVNLSALRPYEGPIPPAMFGAAAEDDGLSFLLPDRYVAIRLGDQLNYYRLKTSRLERRLRRLQWLIYALGGVGTLLAAVGLELWVALTTALVAAFTTFQEYQQVENTLMRYNQAATDLANIRGWWIALPAEEQADQRNVDKLVEHTEKALQSEYTGWMQQMQDALAELYAEQARDEASVPETCE